MRTILYSTEHVSANNWETGLFILFLMVFAIAASAYVLYHGLQVSHTCYGTCPTVVYIRSVILSVSDDSRDDLGMQDDDLAHDMTQAPCVAVSM